MATGGEFMAKVIQKFEVAFKNSVFKSASRAWRRPEGRREPAPKSCIFLT
jgi:hypothetical protein